MIPVTDINGRRHYLNPSAIAEVSVAGTSSQWHGIRSILRTYDGRVLELQEDADRIASMAEQAGEDDSRETE